MSFFLYDKFAMNADNDPIQQVHDELTRHIAGGTGGPFRPSSDASAALAKLSRDLELKRQLGSLTQSESSQLKNSDTMMEKIGQFNKEIGRAHV